MEATQAPAQQPLIIQSGNGTSTGTLVIGAAVIGAGLYFGHRWLKQRQLDAAEQKLTTPAGTIASQLKTIFEKTPVDDEAYRKVSLQITPEIQGEVYRIYKALTLGRNLSDDVAEHIKTGAQATLVKQTQINNTVDSIIKITPEDKILFLVGKNDLVRFPPGAKDSIPLYLDPTHIPINYKPILTLKPSSMQFKVSAVKEQAYNSAKEVADWTKYFRPVVRTRKVYAVVGLVMPMKKTGANTTYLTLWADARLFRKGKGTNYLKGIDREKETTNLSLVV